MSFLRSTVLLRTQMRNITNSAVRLKDRMMADPIEHATGIEQRELLALAGGNLNPFDMRVLKKGPGTRASPNLIPSAFDKRMVGCICHEDEMHLNWMWLYKGEPRRCECGHWFKLIQKGAF